ncbi:MAG: hypothetical protein U9R25_17990 [Chloroflexota bacterium]|nr:hypothetical protein [Chloroflexota bacterium]
MTNESTYAEIKRQANKRILAGAIFRIENAVIILGSLFFAILLPNPYPEVLPWWDWWTWLLLGALAMLMLFIPAVADANEKKKSIERLFQRQNDIGSLKDASLRADMTRVADQVEEIGEAAGRRPDDGFAMSNLDRLCDLEGNLAGLAHRLDAYRVDPVINADREELPASISRLEDWLVSPGDTAERNQVEAMLTEKRRLRDTISELDDRMNQAVLQLEGCVSFVEEMYDRLVINEGVAGSNTLEDLPSEVEGQIDALQDRNRSIDALYDYRVLGLPQQG